MEVLGTLLRVLVVFALLALVLWVLKRTEAGRGARTAAPVQVVGSTRLSKGASLTVVRIGDEQVVLGVTDSAVSVLGSGPAPEPVPVAAPAAGDAGARPDFAAALSASLTRTLGPTGARLLGGAAARATGGTGELSDAAVAAALASVRGDAPPAAAPAAVPAAVPAPRPALETTAVPTTAGLPDPVTRAALHRAVTRTRARTA